MNKENNIDQLLSSRMEGCQVEAPEGLWEAIQADLPTTQFAHDGGVSNKVLSAVKSASLGVKTIIVAGTLALGGIAIFVAQQKADTPPTVNEAQTPSLGYGLNQTPDIKEDNNGLAETTATSVQTGKIKPTRPSQVDGKITATGDIQNEQNQTSLEVSDITLTPAPTQPEEMNPKTEERRASVNNLDEQLQIIKDEEPARKEDFTEKRQPKYYNYISPNGDGKNDTWFVDIEEVADFQLKIYNINGELVFETQDHLEHWKGDNSRSGMLCESGIYLFVLHYKHENETKFNTKNGTIKLFR